MLLRALSQLNFRNLNTPRITFGPGVTAVVGRNAAGKSNLLEAIYLGCTGELPYGKISETVRLGETEGYVSVQVERDDGVVSTQVGLAPGKKVVRLDGQAVRTFELAKVSAAVLITPEDADLIHGAPALRRGYLDSLLSKLSVRYALLHREYTRVVEQRNAALKHHDPALNVWTERFVELGDAVNALRARALVKIAAIAAETYAEISGDDKPLGVTLTGAHKNLADALAEAELEERARGVTVVGPHRGDVLLTLGGHSVQAYGSRGEARTAALSLRVAEYRLLSEKHREAPILLLDDFTAELDAGRREFLLQLASRAPQAVVSGTEAPPHAAAQFLSPAVRSQETGFVRNRNPSQNVSDLLAEVFKKGGLKRGVKRAEAVLLWPQVVGARVARFTEAKTLQDGVLYVEVQDSETAMHLSFQRQKFVNVYTAKFGVKDVKDVRFRLGRRPLLEETLPPQKAATPDPKALAELSRAVSQAELSDELTRRAMSAAKAMLSWRAAREAEGWRTCDVCSGLTPARGLCVTCARYAEFPKVRTAGRTLAVAPGKATPLLSDDERAVAVFQAKAYLAEKLQELLPQTLADPTYRPHLEFAARCYLAHLLEKPLTEVSEDDFSRLDARIARALGRWA